MNTVEPPVEDLASASVAAFVAAVRARFADLHEEERDDILGGLEADLVEQAAESGAASLGDPVGYADELRAAAGLPPFVPTRSPGRGLAGAVAWVEHLVTRSVDTWNGALDRLPWGLGGAVRAALPVWWVMRAWVALMLLDTALLTGGRDVLVLPTGSAGFGAVLVALASLVSIQIGRGKLWPGDPSVVSRLVLLGLNTVAVAGGLLVLDDLQNRDVEAEWRQQEMSYEEPGLRVGDRYLCNLHPYSAAGLPLTGVQLFDGQGRPVNVHCAGAQDENGDGFEELTAPWLMGDVKRWNVFPLGERVGTGNGPVSVPAPPKTSVPPVIAPGSVAPVAPVVPSPSAVSAPSASESTSPRPSR